MSQRITIEIKDKIATCLTETPVVCGNSDYVVDFVFDEEWSEHTVKTARFRFNGEYIDVVFEGNTCEMPIISKAKIIWVGVYAGELSTSTPAIVNCKLSILDDEDVPAPPRKDVYSQIVGLCEEAVSTAKSVEERANDGEFTPQKGADYYTESEKEEIIKETSKRVNVPAKLSDLYDDSVEHMIDKAYRADIANIAGRAWNAERDFSGNVFEKHYSTKAELSTVESIAKGRATGYVFDTVDDMNTWLGDSANIAKLVIGDNLYIRATDVPDYWWDGETVQPLETQKVDLTEYATKTELVEAIGEALESDY